MQQQQRQQLYFSIPNWPGANYLAYLTYKLCRVFELRNTVK